VPNVIVLFFTVPRVRDARSSAGWALVFIALLYTVAPAVGGLARLNLTNTIQSGPVGSAEGNLVYEERLKWLKNWEKTGWDTRARQLQSASRTALMRKCCAGPGRPPIARPGPRMLSTRLSPIHSHHCPYHLHPGTPEFL